MFIVCGSDSVLWNIPRVLSKIENISWNIVSPAEHLFMDRDRGMWVQLVVESVYCEKRWRICGMTSTWYCSITSALRNWQRCEKDARTLIDEHQLEPITMANRESIHCAWWCKASTKVGRTPSFNKRSSRAMRLTLWWYLLSNRIPTIPLHTHTHTPKLTVKGSFLKTTLRIFVGCKWIYFVDSI